jgi:hypothetical protein
MEPTVLNHKWNALSTVCLLSLSPSLIRGRGEINKNQEPFCGRGKKNLQKGNVTECSCFSGETKELLMF